MLTIKNYARPETVDEALGLLRAKKSNVALGGMLWLKLQDKNVDTAVDLSGLGLDAIEETPEGWRIGAMVTLRQLETHKGLAAFTGGALAESVKHIVGVQLRNLATIGGSVFGRFGFSDPLTLLLALDAKVELAEAGRMSLEDFAGSGIRKDILTHVFIPGGNVEAAYLSQRNCATDLPVLTCAVARREGKVACAVGARPARAARFDDEEGLLAGGVSEESAAAFAEEVTRRAAFGSNTRGSAEYRRQVCRELVRRAALKLEEK
ncbi:FAD binding domain-containing protein [Candidatus Allofournierella excrementigallinarum]|uniref:FAD binding domain-containing protein n=1 Tax=Candidatus Allofournierella excrementigallinarum TaxID=2838592 RepID=UPI00374F685B